MFAKIFFIRYSLIFFDLFCFRLIESDKIFDNIVIDGDIINIIDDTINNIDIINNIIDNNAIVNDNVFFVEDFAIFFVV